MINTYLYSSSKNSRVLSEYEQRTFCKGLSIANGSTWHKLHIILSRKPDRKMLLFLACSIMNYYDVELNLPHLFQQFTSDEKQDTAVIRIQRITFYLAVIKYINENYTLNYLLLNLPRIKPEYEYFLSTYHI